VGRDSLFIQNFGASGSECINNILSDKSLYKIKSIIEVHRIRLFSEMKNIIFVFITTRL